MALTVSVKPASNRACFSKSSLSASSATALGPFLWNMTSSDQNSSLSDFYFGGCSSPRNQPTALDFIGSSDGTAICSTRSHSEQSNLLSSNPVGPGEVRASFMRARHFWAAELLNCEHWDCGWVICHCIPPCFRRERNTLSHR